MLFKIRHFRRRQPPAVYNSSVSPPAASRPSGYVCSGYICSFGRTLGSDLADVRRPEAHAGEGGGARRSGARLSPIRDQMHFGCRSALSFMVQAPDQLDKYGKVVLEVFQHHHSAWAAAGTEFSYTTNTKKAFFEARACAHVCVEFQTDGPMLVWFRRSQCSSSASAATISTACYSTSSSLVTPPQHPNTHYSCSNMGLQH